MRKPGHRGWSIPDDWAEANGYLFASFCFPNSRKWRSVINGLVSELFYGRNWDRDTGTIIEAQQIGREVFESMAICDLERLIIAVEAIALALSGPVEEPQPIYLTNKVMAEATAESSSHSSSMALAQLALANNVLVNNYVIAVAQAQAAAISQNFLTITLPAQVPEKTSPTVSAEIAPDLEKYPTEDTGLTDEPITDIGELCQRSHYIVASTTELLKAVRDVMSFTPLALLASSISNILTDAINYTSDVLGYAGIVIPKPVLAALVEYMAGYVGLYPPPLAGERTILEVMDAAVTLLESEGSQMAKDIYCQAVNDATSREIVAHIYNAYLYTDEAVGALLMIVLNEAAIATVFYNTTLFESPSTTLTCSPCGE